jgi:adenosine deaminase
MRNPVSLFLLQRRVRANTRRLMGQRRSIVPNFLQKVTAIILLYGALYSQADTMAESFNAIRQDQVALRQFLQQFPKGGDLHNHLSGTVYAESYLEWASEDGKCIDTTTLSISNPPCGLTPANKPLAEILRDSSSFPIDPIVDALSTRNYDRRTVSGHNQFFATFDRFRIAAEGRFGDMVAEARVRAGNQNISYLELMQSVGMMEAIGLAPMQNNSEEDATIALDEAKIDGIVEKVIERLDIIDDRQNEILGCEKTQPQNAAACEVQVRFLAQVLRNFSPAQVYAQTMLAFKLIQADERIVGLNFVAPEDHRIALRDYKKHMAFVRDLSRQYPDGKKGITLHAGELTLGLVPPEHLGWHIREAVETAGALRIGHGIDIAYDQDMASLLKIMSERKILVEINLTSNDVILGVTESAHPLLTYMRHKVPVTLSTDDEGVSRIDLTHEYQRAAIDYKLSYQDLKEISRNSLQYSFLPGEPLFTDVGSENVTRQCYGEALGASPASTTCAAFLFESLKANLQWQLESRFSLFEARFQNRRAHPESLKGRL